MLRVARGTGFALIGAVVLCAFACGDDDSASDGGANNMGDAGADNGGSGPGMKPPRSGSGGSTSAGAGGSAGQTGSGDRVEGAPCQATADCEDGLACVASGDQWSDICAKPCQTDDDCGVELCVARGQDMADLHCENVERMEFGYCGAVVTALCAEGHICLYSDPSIPLGTCVTLCAVDGQLDAGVDHADGDGGADFASCSAPQECADIELQNEPVDENLGFCATTVARGEECAPELGTLCDLTDICAPVDPAADEVDDFRCREDCTDDGTCDNGGKCQDVSGAFAYCLDPK